MNSFHLFRVNPINRGYLAPSAFIDTRPRVLLDQYRGRGLFVTYRFSRLVDMMEPRFTNISVVFSNMSESVIRCIRIESVNLERNKAMKYFIPVQAVCPGQCKSRKLEIDFDEERWPVKIYLSSSLGTFPLEISAPVGEMFVPIEISPMMYNIERRDATNSEGVIYSSCPRKFVRIIEFANLSIVDIKDSKFFNLAGLSLKSHYMLFVTVEDDVIKVNCQCRNLALRFTSELQQHLDQHK